MSTFANKFARTGCTSAIQASLIALGLHRPCRQNLIALCNYCGDARD